MHTCKCCKRHWFVQGCKPVVTWRNCCLVEQMAAISWNKINKYFLNQDRLLMQISNLKNIIAMNLFLNFHSPSSAKKSCYNQHQRLNTSKKNSSVYSWFRNKIWSLCDPTNLWICGHVCISTPVRSRHWLVNVTGIKKRRGRWKENAGCLAVSHCRSQVLSITWTHKQNTRLHSDIIHKSPCLWPQTHKCTLP